MRLIGMILALAAIGWVLFRGSGGGEEEGAVPAAYRQSLEKAEGVERTVEEAARERLQAAEERDR